MNKILIVIEDQPTSEQFQLWLSQAGYYTALVSTAEGMINFCRQHSPDLIFVDVDSSSQKLWSSIQAIRSFGELANVTFLGASNDQSPETLQKAQEYGFTGVVQKNIDSQTLKNTVATVMTETTQTNQVTSSSSLEKLVALSREVDTVANGLKSNLGEFGADGPELFGYIENSSTEISNKLASINEDDLSDRELRHDFRNMIGSVTGFSELILMEPALSADSQKGLSRLRECSKEFVELLDQQKAAAV